MSKSRQRGSKNQLTIGLVVEGNTEFHALPLLHELLECPPLKATNLRGVGEQNTPVGIAKLAAPSIRSHIIAGRSRVVLCIDRESRKECAGMLAQAIHHELRKELGRTNHDGHDVHVVVADRAFEAWILADARGLHTRKEFKSAPKFHSFEGHMGEQGRKGEVELSRLLGRDYSKSRDGKELFAKLDFQQARRHERGSHGSKSLDKLLRTLGV